MLWFIGASKPLMRLSTIHAGFLEHAQWLRTSTPSAGRGHDPLSAWASPQHAFHRVARHPQEWACARLPRLRSTALADRTQPAVDHPWPEGASV